jgi:hypothetical protein
MGHKPGIISPLDHNNDGFFSRKKFATNPLPLIIISQPSQHRFYSIFNRKTDDFFIDKEEDDLAVTTK